MARVASERVSARVCRVSEEQVVVEFGEAFLKRLYSSIEDLDDEQLHVLLSTGENEAETVDLSYVRTALYVIAEQFMIHHELFHVIGGHLDHKVAASGGKALDLDESGALCLEFGENTSEELSAEMALALYIELEADNSALQMLADYCSLGDLANVLQQTPVPVPIVECTGRDRVLAFRLVFAGVWLLLLALEQGASQRRQPLRLTHPWPAARLMSLLFTLMPYFIDGVEVRSDDRGQQIATLTTETKALTLQYLQEVVEHTMKFVLAHADTDRVIARFRTPDPQRSDLFADVLHDLHALLFDEEVNTAGGRQMLALASNRRAYFDLFRAFRYVQSAADYELRPYA